MAEIANRIYETSEGQILFISDFSDINDNEKVVSRALSVEEKKGNIVRLANGVYLRPKNTRFGIVYPSIDEMVMAIAQRDKVQIQPSGVTALNKLGLSTQEPITGYTYNGFEEKSNYKSSNTILITYKSKQYVLHTGDRVLDKIKSGDFPKLYYSSKTDYLFFEGDYLPVGYAKAALLFTFVFPIIGTLIWRKELNNDIRTM